MSVTGNPIASGSTTTLKDLFDRVITRLSREVPVQNFTDTFNTVVRHIDNRLNVLRSDLLVENHSHALAIGNSTITLNRNHLGLKANPVVSYEGYTKKTLLPLPEDKRYSYTDTGMPEYYETEGLILTLFPATNVGLTVKFQAFESTTMATTLSSTVPYSGLFDSFISDVIVKYGADPVAASVDPMLEYKAYGEVDRIATRRTRKHITFRGA